MKTRLCFFDCECSNLNANFGILMSFGWKFQGEKKVYVISIADYPEYKKDPTNDKYLLQDVVKILSTADMICGHYSQRFDIPFIQTRLLYHNLPPLPNITHIDTWRIAKYKMKLNSNRLDTIAKFLEVPYQKTPVSGPNWIKAMAGDKKSLRYIIEHNKYDVLVLEEVYNRIRCLSTQHPNVNIVSGKKDSCPVCGESDLQKRGFSVAYTTRSQRFHCQSCGAWSRGKPEQIKGLEIR